MKRQLTIAIAISCIGAAAGAQTIYRCGSTYSQQPCAGATAVEASSRTPTSAEAEAARKQAERDMKLATAMETTRLREEAKPVAAYIPKEKVEEAPKPHQPEVFVARVPGEKKKPAKKKKRA